MKNIISLGAGVQSSTMALMAAKGEITPMPDCAIFADTGWEPKRVYEWLDWLETQLPFPVYRVSKGNLRDDIVNSFQKQRFASVPFYTESENKTPLSKIDILAFSSSIYLPLRNTNLVINITFV